MTPSKASLTRPLDARLLCLAGDMQGTPFMDLVECRVPFLDVVANRIDHRSGTCHGPRDRRFVRYIGVYELDPAISTELPKEACTVRMAYAHTHLVLGVGQVFHDLAAEASGPPEDCYEFGRHQLVTPAGKAATTSKLHDRRKSAVDHPLAVERHRVLIRIEPAVSLKQLVNPAHRPVARRLVGPLDP